MSATQEQIAYADSSSRYPEGQICREIESGSGARAERSVEVLAGGRGRWKREEMNSDGDCPITRTDLVHHSAAYLQMVKAVIKYYAYFI